MFPSPHSSHIWKRALRINFELSIFGTDFEQSDKLPFTIRSEILIRNGIIREYLIYIHLRICLETDRSEAWIRKLAFLIIVMVLLDI